MKNLIKTAVSKRVLSKMENIAKSKGMSSIEDYINNFHKVKFNVINLIDSKLVQLPRTLQLNGKYFKEKKNLSMLDRSTLFKEKYLFGDSTTYKGSVNATKESPLTDFKRTLSNEDKKKEAWFSSNHPEVAIGYSANGAKGQTVYAVKRKNLQPVSLPYGLRYHVGNYAIRPKSLMEDLKISNIFNDYIQKGKLHSINKKPDLLPSYENLSTHKGIPKQVEPLVIINGKKRLFHSLGVMSPKELENKHNSIINLYNVITKKFK